MGKNSGNHNGVPAIGAHCPNTYTVPKDAEEGQALINQPKSTDPTTGDLFLLCQSKKFGL